VTNLTLKRSKRSPQTPVELRVAFAVALGLSALLGALLLLPESHRVVDVPSPHPTSTLLDAPILPKLPRAHHSAE
jgi:hypothetical protein